MKNYTDEKQFKADIRKYAENHHISGNEIGRLWQEVMLDDLLKRISLSEYKNNFILKGGLLLSAVVGINNRSTEDIDGEIKGLDLTENEIEKVFTSICNIKPDNDPLEITLSEIEKIHENEEYKGYRLHFNASFKSIKYPLKVDISTGDVIMPREIRYDYTSHLENEKIEIWAYTMETVVAEKLETVITRGIANTRMKDFYDLYILQDKNIEINIATLKLAFTNTAKYRNVSFYKKGKLDKKYCLQQIHKIEKSQRMQGLWQRYEKKHPFAENITFDQTVSAAKSWINRLVSNE